MNLKQAYSIFDNFSVPVWFNSLQFEPMQTSTLITIKYGINNGTTQYHVAQTFPNKNFKVQKSWILLFAQTDLCQNKIK